MYVGIKHRRSSLTSSIDYGVPHQIIHPGGVYYLCDTYPYGVNLTPWILNINDNQLYNPDCLLRIHSGGDMNCVYHLCFAVCVLSYHQQVHLYFQSLLWITGNEPSYCSTRIPTAVRYVPVSSPE